MKKNFRIFSIILTLAIMMSALVIPVSAAQPPQPYGDVNSDKAIDILDATNVQRYLAKVDLDAINLLEAADVDDDAKITVLDVTVIQQYVAHAIEVFPAGKLFTIDKYFYEMQADYDYDSAIAGYPVTFSASGSMQPGPATAKLYINDELVGQTQETNQETYMYEITYTFEKSGTYNVKMTLSDKWGEGDSKTAVYTVKDAPADTSTPVITAVTRDNNYNTTPVFTVHTKFGTAPYKYTYAIGYDDSDAPYFDPFYYTDPMDSNILDITETFGENAYLNPLTDYVIFVQVTDANGNKAVEKHPFVIDVLKPA